MMNGLGVLRRNDLASVDKPAQIQVGLAIDANKIKRVFGLARARIVRVGIEDVADGWRRDHLQDDLRIGSKEGIAEVKIGEFVVDVSVAENKFYIGTRGLQDHFPGGKRVEHIERYPEAGHWKRTNVFVAPIDGRRGSSDASFAAENRMSGFLAQLREAGDAVPELDHLDAEATLGKGRAESLNLGALSRAIDSREGDQSGATP
jgi:hypothetical protein